MFERDKKIEAEIIGQVIGFEGFRSYKDELITWIKIKCDSDGLEEPIEERFNYSAKWNKLDLKKGDKIKFKAKLKTTEFVVHRTERWRDDWGRLPFDMTDIEVQIEVQYPKQIIKL